MSPQVGFCTLTGATDTNPIFQSGNFKDLRQYLDSHERVIPMTRAEFDALDDDQQRWQKSGPAIVLASFKRSGVRLDAEVAFTCGLGLDVDEAHVDQGELIALLDGVSAIIYESSRSTPGARRWRVFIEYAHPCTPAQHESAFEHWRKRIPGVSKQSRNPSRLWYAVQRFKGDKRRIIRTLKGAPYEPPAEPERISSHDAFMQRIKVPVDAIAHEGERNAQLSRFALSVIGRCATEEDLFAELAIQNAKYQPVPLPVAEVRSMARAKWKRFAPATVVAEAPDADTFWNFNEVLEAPYPDWLLAEVCARRQVGAIYGEPYAGKSALAFAITMALSAGAPVLGDLDQWEGNIGAVYFALEGNLRSRAEPYRKEGFISATPRVRFERSLRITLDTERAIACQLLHDRVAQACELDPRLGLVIIDTLARASGVDENSADLGAIAEAMRVVAEEYDVCVILVHHSGKDASKGLRGHSSFYAALDFAIEVNVERDGLGRVTRRTFTVAKQREGQGEMTREFEIRGIELGTHPKRPDKRISGPLCVVKGGEAKRATLTLDRPRGTRQKTAYAALCALVIKASRHPDARLTLRGWGVPTLVLEEAIVAKLTKGKGHDRRREIARQALNALSGEWLHFHEEGGVQYAIPSKFVDPEG